VPELANEERIVDRDAAAYVAQPEAPQVGGE
jgi:hypothetical protein